MTPEHEAEGDSSRADSPVSQLQVALIDNAEWHYGSQHVRGATHLRAGLPCQDRSWAAASSEGDNLYMIVADGHGSAPYFRSDRGADFACAALAEVFESLAPRLQSTRREAAQAVEWFKSTAPTAVVNGWLTQVRKDLVSTPPDRDAEPMLDRQYRTLEELGTARAEDWLRHLQTMVAHMAADPENVLWSPAVSAYGSTVLGVMVGGGYLFWFQLGDGVLIEYDEGQARLICEPPAGALANETPSLCQAEAAKAAIWNCRTLAGREDPGLLMAATDGFSNSFEDDAGMFKFATDVLNRVATQGIGSVENNLHDWLVRISEGGSGDDVAVALAFDQTATQRSPTMPEPPLLFDSQSTEVDPVDEQGRK